MKFSKIGEPRFWGCCFTQRRGGAKFDALFFLTGLTGFDFLCASARKIRSNVIRKILLILSEKLRVLCTFVWAKKDAGFLQRPLQSSVSQRRLLRAHLAHRSTRPATDTGACRFMAGLLARLLVITVITQLLQKTFFVHHLLQTLERALDGLAFLQSHMDHAVHPLPVLPR